MVDAFTFTSLSTYPISSVAVNNGGGGITKIPSVTAVSNFPTDVNGDSASLTGLGILGPIQINSGGTGYHANDVIVFSGGTGIGAHANRTASRVTTIVGDDPGAPRAEKMARTTKLVKTKTGWKKVQAESLDTYDIVLMHLLDEGYASHPDAAEAIMVNMSEQWIKSILG